MRTAGWILCAALAAAVGACAHRNVQGPAAENAGAAQPAGCPLAQLQGVHATVADIRDGVAITFTGPQGELDQLRDNVHAMADANDKQGDAFAACPCGVSERAMGTAESMPGDHATTPGGGPSETGARKSTAQKPLAEAKVDEIATGAVLKLKAKDSTEAGALRAATRENVRAMRKNCLGRAAGQGESQSPTEHQGTTP
jgi:hypothetical protein